MLKPTSLVSSVTKIFLYFFFLIYSCIQGTVATTVLDNSKALEASFSISSFQFQNQANVNLFCDVRLCDKKSETCSGVSDQYIFSDKRLTLFCSNEHCVRCPWALDDSLDCLLARGNMHTLLLMIIVGSTAIIPS